MIICLTLLCGYAKAQTRGGDSSPPLPKEISAELFDKAVALIKEFEGWHSAKHYPLTTNLRNLVFQGIVATGLGSR